MNRKEITNRAKELEKVIAKLVEDATEAGIGFTVHIDGGDSNYSSAHMDGGFTFTVDEDEEWDDDLEKDVTVKRYRVRPTLDWYSSSLEC